MEGLIPPTPCEEGVTVFVLLRKKLRLKDKPLTLGCTARKWRALAAPSTLRRLATTLARGVWLRGWCGLVSRVF